MITDEDIVQGEASLRISDTLTGIIRKVHDEAALAEPHSFNLNVIVAGVAESLGALMHTMPADQVEVVLRHFAEDLRDFHRLNRNACPCHGGAGGAGCTRH
jgi:hypothetical protein